MLPRAALLAALLVSCCLSVPARLLQPHAGGGAPAVGAPRRGEGCCGPRRPTLRLRGGYDFYREADTGGGEEVDEGVAEGDVAEAPEGEDPYALDAKDRRTADDMDEWVHHGSGGAVLIDAHEKEVKTLVTLRRGEVEYLVTGDGMGLILVWETDTFKCRKVLRGHRYGIGCLALSEDHETLFSGAWDNDIWAWSTGTWKGRRVVRGIGEVSYQPSITRNPNILMSCPGHEAAVLSLCALEGGLLASGDMHGKVAVWETGGWRRVATLEDHEEEVWALAEHRGTDVLFSAGEDWHVSVWDKKTWKLLSRWEGHTGPVRSLLTVGDVLLSGSSDCTIRAWSPLTGACAMVVEGHTGWILGMCVTSDCERLYAACSDGSFYVRSTLDWGLIREETGHKDYTSGVSLVRGESMVASSSYDMNVLVRPA